MLNKKSELTFLWSWYINAILTFFIEISVRSGSLLFSLTHILLGFIS